MENKNIPKRITLAYFSGTGCTKAVCDCFEEQLRKMGVDSTVINIADQNPLDVKETDLLIVFSPVYAFRLAAIVETWIKNLPVVKNKSAVIISVSGGGEMPPNMACRVHGKRLLERKGYAIIYEEMIVMPSNFASQADHKLNYDLIRVLPNKVKRVIADIVSGNIRITSPKLLDRFIASIGKAEHFGARFFGASIHASQECNQCGLCIRNCPKKNIRMVNGLPKFGYQCLWCLKCIYSCPCKALTPRIMKFSVLKEGFDLDSMSEKALKESDVIEDREHSNILWQGVIDYVNHNKGEES